MNRRNDLPDFTDPRGIGMHSDPQEQEVDMEDVHCADGWVVEMRSVNLPAGADPQLVGIAVHSSQTCLADAFSEAQDRLEHLIESGQFVEPGEGDGFEVTPSALGSVTDSAGNQIAIEDED